MRPWFAIVTMLAFSTSDAAGLVVRVLDRDGRPASGLVITVQGGNAAPATTAAVPATAAAPALAATMDQLDQRFVPFVLPVRTGTAVTFPNSDSIAHQVYSFSPTKRFELGLYRGRPYPPVVFDKPGIVVLGCNIHDKMIGYVYVTDATEFGKTDEKGAWHSSVLAAGRYGVEVWSPLLARDEPSLKRTIELTEVTPGEVELRLTRPLRPEPRPQPDAKIRDY